MQHKEVQQARYGKGRTYLQMCVSSYLPCSTSLHSLADARRHPAFSTSKLAWRYRAFGWAGNNTDEEVCAEYLPTPLRNGRGVWVNGAGGTLRLSGGRRVRE